MVLVTESSPIRALSREILYFQSAILRALVSASLQKEPRRARRGSENARREADDANGRADHRIIGNRTSKVYHLPNCPDYSKVSERNRVAFKSEAEAKAAGYRKARTARSRAGKTWIQSC
jgi:hypothetical protein